LCLFAKKGCMNLNNERLPRVEQTPVWRLSQRVPLALKERGVQGKYLNLHRLDQAGQVVTATFTLCPLYERGTTLQQSSLQQEAASIETSRVAQKWDTFLQIVTALQQECLVGGKELHLILSFADRGIITPIELENTQSVLQNHLNAYRNSIEQNFAETGLSYTFQTYGELLPEFPLFILPAENEVSFSEDQLAVELNDAIERLAQTGITLANTASIKDAKAILRTLAQTIRPGGKYRQTRITYNFPLAEGLIRQYAQFDAATTLPDALNIFIERDAASVLLQISKLFTYGQNPIANIIC
jgi:hypothetical protein